MPREGVERDAAWPQALRLLQASAARLAVALIPGWQRGLEGQRARIDAIALACGSRPVAENMAQMAAAAATDHLRTAQE